MSSIYKAGKTHFSEKMTSVNDDIDNMRIGAQATSFSRFSSENEDIDNMRRRNLTRVLASREREGFQARNFSPVMCQFIKAPRGT